MLAYNVVLPDEQTHVRTEVAELVHSSGDGTRRQVSATQALIKQGLCADLCDMLAICLKVLLTHTHIMAAFKSLGLHTGTRHFWHKYSQ